jgi:hypothetical protein
MVLEVVVVVETVVVVEVVVTVVEGVDRYASL